MKKTDRIFLMTAAGLLVVMCLYSITLLMLGANFLELVGELFYVLLYLTGVMIVWTILLLCYEYIVKPTTQNIVARILNWHENLRAGKYCLVDNIRHYTTDPIDTLPENPRPDESQARWWEFNKRKGGQKRGSRRK